MRKEVRDLYGKSGSQPEGVSQRTSMFPSGER